MADMDWRQEQARVSARHNRMDTADRIERERAFNAWSRGVAVRSAGGAALDSLAAKQRSAHGEPGDEKPREAWGEARQQNGKLSPKGSIGVSR